MQIEFQNSLFTANQLVNIEEMKKAKFICETSVRTRNGEWCNFPVAIFYQETAHSRGSNYFGLYFDQFSGRSMICDGISALEPFSGVQTRHGLALYSRYRHDYVTSRDGSTFVDGGREYMRYNPASKLVRLEIQKDKLIAALV